METKRLFAAIKIKPGKEFLEIYTSIRQILDFNIIKWVEPENIHITLKFFGETPSEEIPVIAEALTSSASGIEPFELTLENTGIFGSYYAPRVIWVGIKHNNMLNKLVGQVVENLEKSGYLSDRQNFVPHLTMGRIKEIKDKNHFQEVISHFSKYSYQKQQISGFELYESILRKEGPEYHVVEEFSFR